MEQQVWVKIILERDGNAVLAYAPGLQGCMTWGDSVQEALENMTEVLSMYVESLGDFDEDIPYGPDVLAQPPDSGLVIDRETPLPFPEHPTDPQEAWEAVPA